MGIYRFSLISIFLYMSLDSVHIRKNVAQRKPLYLHILCSVQLSLLVNLTTTFFSTALTKFCASNTKLAALISFSAFFFFFFFFFLQSQVRVYISGSVYQYIYWTSILSLLNSSQILEDSNCFLMPISDLSI